MAMDDEDDIRVDLGDMVRCTICGTTCMVKDLRRESWDDCAVPKPGGGYEHPVYLYCPNPACKDDRAKGFTWGNGEYMLGIHVELVEQDQPA